MKRQANRDDPAYRDKKINEEYKRRNNPKRPTEGELLRESGGYLKDPETEIDTSQPLQSSTNPLDDLTINKGKFRDDARQKKIRDLSEKPGTEAEGQAARRKLKDQTDLPQFFQVTDPQAEELSEYDEKMRQAGELSGQEKIEAIKKANRSRPDWAAKSAEFLSEVWEDTKEWKEWYRPGANLGALGARGLEAFFTFESDDIQSLSWEALDKLLGTKGIGMSIIKEIPIIKDQVLPVLARRLSIINKSLNRKASWIKGDLQPALATVDEGTGNFKTYEPLQMSGTGGTNPMRGDKVPQQARMYFSKSGLRGGVFDLKKWRQAGSDRNVMELFQTRWDQVAYREMPHKQFTSTRKRLIKPFLKEYAPYLKKFNIDPSTIELHHIFGLNLSAPLYDGLRYGSKEWEEMTTLLNKQGLFPGAPATEVAKKSNLMLALEEPHDLLHNQFFKDTIGVKGEKFFTPERMKILHSGPDGRKQIAKEYAKHVKKGEVLIKRAMDQIQATFGASNISPEKLADAFSQSLADGTTNIFKEGYRIESVNKVIKDMVLDIQLDEMVEPLRKRAFNSVSELKQEVLLDRASGMSNKELRRKYGKNFDIKQLDLFDK